MKGSGPFVIINLDYFYNPTKAVWIVLKELS